MTFTLTDLDKVLYWVKVVPDAEPNADGEWCTLFMHPRNAKNYDYVNSILPRGQHTESLDDARQVADSFIPIVVGQRGNTEG